HVDTEFRVLRRMEALEEVAARVAVHHGFDDADAGQIGVDAFEVGVLGHAMRFSYCSLFSPREKGRNAAFSFARSAGCGYGSAPNGTSREAEPSPAPSGHHGALRHGWRLYPEGEGSKAAPCHGRGCASPAA